jgi:hypothetical protein
MWYIKHEEVKRKVVVQCKDAKRKIVVQCEEARKLHHCSRPKE